MGQPAHPSWLGKPLVALRRSHRLPELLPGALPQRIPGAPRRSPKSCQTLPDAPRCSQTRPRRPQTRPSTPRGSPQPKLIILFMLLRSRLLETQVLELCLSMFRAWLLVPLTLCDDKFKGYRLVLSITHTTCNASVSMMLKERSRTETKVSELVVSGSRSPSTCALYAQIIHGRVELAHSLALSPKSFDLVAGAHTS